MSTKEAKPTAPAHVPRVKKGAPKQLGSPGAAPQDGAARGLPEASAQVPETPRVVTQSVKVLYTDGKGPLRCKEIGVREGKMVEADADGKDQLVALPGPLLTSPTHQRINGIELAAGEQYINLSA